MPQTKRILGDISFYSVSIILTQTVTVIAAILMRRFLGPVQVGVWSFVQVLLMYSEYSSLGTMNSLALEIPFYNGKGNTEKATRVKNTVYSFSLMASVLFSAGVLVYAVVKRASMPEQLFYGFLFAAGLSFLQRVNGLLISLLRAYKYFTLAGKQMLYSSLVNAFLICILAFYFRLYGFMTAMVLSFLFNIFYILKNVQFDFCFSLDLGELGALIRYGFALMIIAFLGTFFETIDRLMISKFLGFEALGHYSIALMTSAFIFSVPNSVGIVVFPNMQERFGQSENIKALKGYLAKASLVFSCLIPILIGLAWFALPYFVQWILPRFIPGIDAMRLLILGAYFLAIGQTYSQFIYTIRKHIILLPFIVFASGLAVFFNWAAIRQGLGINGVAGATALALASHFTILYIYVAFKMDALGDAIRNYLILIMKFLYMIGMLLLINAFIVTSHTFLTMVLQLIAYLLCYLPFILEINRKFAIIKVFTEKFFKKAQA